MPSFELAILVPLLAAHFLSDFTFQPDSLVRRKHQPLPFLIHIFTTAAITYVLLGDFGEWLIPAIVFATHGFIDFLKISVSKNRNNDFALFAFDQTAHLAVIFALASFDWASLSGFEPWWADHNPRSYLTSLTFIAAVIATTQAAGHLIAKALPKMLSTAPTELHANTGLNGAGRYIGYLERLLLLVFVLAGQLAAAGLLIAAKSVLRFQKANESRRETEYILLGTLLSFTIGILIAYATRQLIP